MVPRAATKSGLDSKQLQQLEMPLRVAATENGNSKWKLLVRYKNRQPTKAKKKRTAKNGESQKEPQIELKRGVYIG